MNIFIGLLFTVVASLGMAKMRKSWLVRGDLGRMSDQWLAEHRASTSGPD